ncbi:MAG: hypothetical protein ABUR63_04305, partial [Verrucomicrobiota bacterium]
MGRRPDELARGAALLLTAALAACGGNVTVARGFESRQVLSLRDPTIRLDYAIYVVGRDPTLVYSTQPEGALVPTRWSVDLATGAVHDTGLDPPSTGVTGSGTPRYVCGANSLLPDGTTTVEITDTTTGATVDIDRVTSFGGCVRDDGTFAAFRRDSATGGQLLWTGPYQQMAPVALPFDVLKVASYLTDTSGQVSTALVLGASPAQPDAAGLYKIDLTSDAVAEVVPATPASPAWATGAPQAGS